MLFRSADRVIYLNPIRSANDKVILAMGGRSVHGASARLGGYVVTEDNGYLTIQKRMLQQLIFKGTALATTQDCYSVEPKALGTGLGESLGDD